MELKEIESIIKIETYWNVNYPVFTTSVHDVTIKIETYWNVNEKWNSTRDVRTSLK